MLRSLVAGSGRRLLGLLVAAMFVFSACRAGSGAGGAAKPGGAGAVEPTRFVFDAVKFVDPTTSTNQ